MAQAIAPYLHGQDFAGLGIIHLSAFWWPIINRLPAHLRQRLYQFGAWREGVLPEWLGRVRAEALSRWILATEW